MDRARGARRAVPSHQGRSRARTARSRACSQVLRRSLQEAQKRCEALNGDMLRQTEANDELMATLNTVQPGTASGAGPSSRQTQ